MIAPQTKLILGTLATLVNLVPHSSTTGIISFSFSLDVIVSSNLPDYCFMSQNLPLNSGGLVSVDPLHGPLRNSFRLYSTSGFMRRV
jgi:hypothetical protein